MAFTDDFNRATLGATWETVMGTSWVTASSLYLKPSQIYIPTAVRVVGTFPADQYAEVWTEVINDADHTNPAPAVRMDVSGNCYFLEVLQGTVSIYKRVAGTNTYLNGWSVSLSYATLIKFKLTVTGTTLEAFVSDVSKGTATDSSLTSGNPGCYALTGQSATFPRFDDFNSSDLVVAGGGSSRLTLLGAG